MSIPDATPDEKSNAGQRPRWFMIYFMVAAMGLLAVLFSLYVSHSIMDIYINSNEVNQEWAHRQAQFARLNQLAIRLNAPGNDVFDSRNTTSEQNRFFQYQSDYNEQYHRIISDLQENVSPEIAAPIIVQIEQADSHVSALHFEASQIFTLLNNNENLNASRHMAAMDRAYAQASDAIAVANTMIRAVQTEHFNTQRHEAERLRSHEVFIAILTILMVSGMVMYGMMLAKRMRRIEKDKETYLRKIKHSEDRYRLYATRNDHILSSIAQGVYGLDKDGKTTFVNPAAAQMLGYRVDELIDIALHEKIHHSFPNGQPYPRERCPIYTALNEGKSIRIIDEVMWRKDGTSFPVEYLATPMYDDAQNLIGAVVTFNDISERIETENILIDAKSKAESATLAKSQFLATMSHEIRTPMNGVIGMADLLSKTELTNQQSDYLQTITSSAENLLVIINDILDYSKIEAGKMEFEIIDTDLEHNITELSRLLITKANEKGIEIILDYRQEVPRFVKADSNRIRQVLVNLIGNAIKFTERGHVLIKVELIHAREKSNVIRISIEDTGIGISPDVINILFSSFTQADASTTRKFGGTGLGLAISKRLVNMMGGYIEVQSTPGEGSCFWFELELGHSSVADQIANYNLANKRVLIVDDYIVNRQILTHMLHDFAMETASAENAEQAIAILEQAASIQQPFDLAIIDYCMPDLNGLDLGKQIKHTPAIANTHLILATSAADDEIITNFQNYGFSTFVAKPLNMHTLRITLNRILSENKSPTANSPKQQPIEKKTMIQGKILLVEDNEVNQLVATAILEQWQLRPVIAVDGKDAIDKWRANKPDIILMDCQMPVMDGYEACKKIRDLEQANEHVPIIALTANAMQGDREKCFAAGMDDYLSKPFKEDEIYNMLNKWLERATKGANSTVQPDAATTANTNVVYMNKTTLANLQKFLSEDKLHTLLARYLADSAVILQQLDSALAGENQEESRRLTHSLKSTSANVGAMPLSEQAKELEELAREGHLNEVSSRVGSLRHCFEQTKSAIEVLDIMRSRKTG